MPQGEREGPVAVDVRATVERAMASLPTGQRRLLENIGADRWQVVNGAIGETVDEFRLSAGLAGLSGTAKRQLAEAYGAWIKELRLILIRGTHPGLRGLSPAAAEAFIAHVVWHEAAHALSVERCSREDIAAGKQLIELCPHGVAQDIRAANYRASSYTHEIVAEVFALLMERRQRGDGGRPAWLNANIYDVACRVTGWTG